RGVPVVLNIKGIHHAAEGATGSHQLGSIVHLAQQERSVLATGSCGECRIVALRCAPCDEFECPGERGSGLIVVALGKASRPANMDRVLLKNPRQIVESLDGRGSAETESDIGRCESISH